MFYLLVFFVALINFFIPRQTKWGRGYWHRLGCQSVRPASGFPHFVSEAELCNPCMDFFNLRHTHPLGGVDVPIGFFEL